MPHLSVVKKLVKQNSSNKKTPIMASNTSAMGAEEGKQMCCLESSLNRTKLNSTPECCSDQHEPALAERTKIILISIHLFLISVLGNSFVFKAFHKIFQPANGVQCDSGECVRRG